MQLIYSDVTLYAANPISLYFIIIFIVFNDATQFYTEVIKS